MIISVNVSISARCQNNHLNNQQKENFEESFEKNLVLTFTSEIDFSDIYFTSKTE